MEVDTENVSRANTSNNIPPNTIAECLSPLDLSEKSDILFDLTVLYSGIEHDGLGRYGDPVNPDGDVSAMREMWLLTRPGGVLLVSEYHGLLCKKQFCVLSI